MSAPAERAIRAARASGDDAATTARAEILAAASHALAEHGYHGMSMRDLARATGRSPASFYNHFDSKEELLFAIQRDAFASLRRAASRALEGVTSPRVRLYAFVLNHVRSFAANPDVMRVLVHEASALPPERRAIIREHKQAYFDTARALVEEVAAHAEGGLSAPELERATYCLFGMLNWMYGWYDRSVHGSPEELARTIHAIALGGVGASCPDGAALKEIETEIDRRGVWPLLGDVANEGRIA